MSIRDNVVKAVRKIAKLEGSQSRFANKIGVSRQTVANWVNGSNAPDIEIISVIADAYHVPMSSILNGLEDGPTINFDEDDDGYVNIPVYGEIAAGTPIDMLEFEDEFPIPRRVKAAHPSSGLLRIKGDSYNKTLPNGYLALVDFADKEPSEHAPFAVCVNGHSATIKSVQRLANGFKLIPHSWDPTYLPKIYDYNQPDTDEITIIGKVVWATMPFDYDI